MKEQLLKLLADAGVTRVDVDKDADMNGRPATGVTVYLTRNKKQYWLGFEFAKDNKMSPKLMATVIASHINDKNLERVDSGNES